MIVVQLFTAAVFCSRRAETGEYQKDDADETGSDADGNGARPAEGLGQAWRDRRRKDAAEMLGPPGKGLTSPDEVGSRSIGMVFLGRMENSR